MTTAITCETCEYCRADRRQLCADRRNLGTHLPGAFAEYVVIDAKLVLKVPDNIPLDEAALAEPLACAVHAVMGSAHVTACDWVLVSGPGAVGLFCAQIAKAEGANVIVCGTSQDLEKLQIAKSLGADYTVNVQEEDLQKRVEELTGNRGVDVAFECAGVAPSARQCLAAVKKRGKYHQVGIFGKALEWDMDSVLFREITVTSSFGHTHYGFRKGLQLISEGRVQIKPLIHAKLPLEDWKKGFEMVESKAGIKVLLYP